MSPEALLGQLVEAIALLAAPADEEEEWVVRNSVPIEEMVLQFYDEHHSFIPRLLETKMIDQPDEELLDQLRNYLWSRSDPDIYESWDMVRGNPQWRRIRELAGAALASLGRQLKEKRWSA